MIDTQTLQNNTTLTFHINDILRYESPIADKFQTSQQGLLIIPGIDACFYPENIIVYPKEIHDKNTQLTIEATLNNAKTKKKIPVIIHYVPHNYIETMHQLKDYLYYQPGTKNHDIAILYIPYNHLNDTTYNLHAYSKKMKTFDSIITNDDIKNFLMIANHVSNVNNTKKPFLFDENGEAYTMFFICDTNNKFPPIVFL